ncbi:MAG: TrkA C-terminal domain-containing protein [Thermoanaerobaculia bacterium]|nr:TrkA C-terminal domain-containing protein [Thermoanaerobaculia bacterium]
MGQGKRVDGTGGLPQGTRVAGWLGKLVGRAGTPTAAVRLYQIGSKETVLLPVPEVGYGFDPTAGWSATAAVDSEGLLRPAGEAPQARDALLLAGSPGELAGRLKAHWRPPVETRIHDLRDHSGVVAGIRVRVTPSSSFAGRTLTELRFRQRYWTVVTALWHRGRPVSQSWGEHPLAPGDEFVALGRRKRVEELTRLAELEVLAFGRPEEPGIDQQILTLSVPKSSALVGTNLRSGSLGGLVELSIVGIRRRGEPRLAISQEDPIRAGDPLLAVGEGLQILRLLQRGLVAAEDEVDQEPD